MYVCIFAKNIFEVHVDSKLKFDEFKLPEVAQTFDWRGAEENTVILLKLEKVETYMEGAERCTNIEKAREKEEKNR
jgi:hypothetical protein